MINELHPSRGFKQHKNASFLYGHSLLFFTVYPLCTIVCNINNLLTTSTPHHAFSSELSPAYVWVYSRISRTEMAKSHNPPLRPCSISLIAFWTSSLSNTALCRLELLFRPFPFEDVPCALALGAFPLETLVVDMAASGVSFGFEARK